MAVVNTYEQFILAEDVEDEVYLISPVDSPVASMSKTIRATGKLHQWSEDELAAPVKNAAVEGADAAAPTFVPVAGLQNYTQIMTKTATVTGSMEEHDKYGRDSEMSFQLEKKYAELSNEEEFAITGSGQQAGTAGLVGTAREMSCLQSFIDAGNVEDATAVADAPGLEMAILDANLAAYTAGAQPGYMVIPPAVGNIVAAFAYSAGKTRDIRNETTVVNVVDLYAGPHGELSVVMSRFMDPAEILLLDFDYLATPVFRTTRDWPLAKKGDSDERQILRESTCAVLNTKANALVTNIDVATIRASLSA